MIADHYGPAMVSDFLLHDQDRREFIRYHLLPGNARATMDYSNQTFPHVARLETRFRPRCWADSFLGEAVRECNDLRLGGQMQARGASDTLAPQWNSALLHLVDWLIQCEASDSEDPCYRSECANSGGAERATRRPPTSS